MGMEVAAAIGERTLKEWGGREIFFLPKG